MVRSVPSLQLFLDDASINRFWAVKLLMAMTGILSSRADASWRAAKWASEFR